MMGVASNRWYEENNIPYITRKTNSRFLKEQIEVKEYITDYCCGRIDIHGVPDEPYGLEYGVGIMESDSWIKLSDWLSSLRTSSVLSKDEIFEKFEKENNHKIKWFKK